MEMNRWDKFFFPIGSCQRIKIALLLLLCCSTWTLIGQEIPQIINYRPNEQGLNDQNWMITQSCEGDLFVANSAGIFRFNGFRWTLIPFFRNGRVRAIYRGSDCRIYCGGYESFGYLEQSGANFSYQPISDEAFQTHDEEIWHITGSEDRVLFQSFSEIYDFDFEEVRYINPNYNILFGAYASEQFIFPLIDQNGFAVYQDGRLSVTLNAAQKKRYKIVGICMFKGEILVATEKNGLFRYQSGKLQPITDQPLLGTLGRDRVNRILAHSDGHLIIGTLLNGIYILDSTLQPILHINREAGLSNNTVLSLFEDGRGDIWVGTNDGINQIKWSSPDRYFYDRKDEIGVIFAHTYFEGTEYFGTNKGLFKGNGTIGFENIPELNGQVWSLWQDDNGEVLVGHNDGTFSIREGRVKKISDVTGGQKMELIGQDSLLQTTYTGWLLFTRDSDGTWRFASRIPGSRLLLEAYVLSGTSAFGFNSNEGLVRQLFSDDFSEVLQTTALQGESAIALYNTPKFRQHKGQIFFTTGDKLFEIRDSTYRESGQSLSELFPEAEIYLSRGIKPIQGGYARIGEKVHGVESDSVYIDYLSVNDRQIAVPVGRLKLGSNTNSLKIQLGSVHFGSQVEPLYFSFASEFNQVWTKVPVNGEIVLNEPKPNTYTLLIGNLKDRPLEVLQLSIRPPWYQSRVGFLGFFLLGVALIYLAGRRQKLKARALLEEKERHLENARILAANHRLEQEVQHKSELLANSTMTIIQKNKMLNELKEYVHQELHSNSQEKDIRNRLVRMINRNINSDEDWQIFENNFNQIHKEFMDRLKAEFPELSAKDLQLAAYLRMGLQSKEIAPLLNVSDRSVDNNRYRLRKKLGLGSEDNLREFVMNY